MIQGLRTQADAATLRVAIRLLERGARTTLVRVATGLPGAGVRSLYAQVHGRRPPQGPPPQQVTEQLAPRRRHVHAALLAALYQGLTPGRAVLDPEALVDAYDAYEAFAPEDRQMHGLDINGAWLIARDLRAGALRLHPCPHCGSPYLRAPAQPPGHCPQCGQALGPVAAAAADLERPPHPAGPPPRGGLRAIERADEARVHLALRMLRHQPRVAIVALATGLPEGALTAIYHDLHGAAPRSGPLPEGVARLMVPRRRHVHAALLAALYQGLTRGRAVLDPQALADAYERYADWAPADRLRYGLSFNEAWILARDLRTGEARLHRCVACGGPWLALTHSPVTPGCPTCTRELNRTTVHGVRRGRERPSCARGAAALADAGLPTAG